MFAVVMAAAVGEEGSVVAVEPDPTNVGRLRSNLALNEASNVRIVQAAATNKDGSHLLHLSEDAAYHSLKAVIHAAPSTADVVVEGLRLDDIWRDAGEPVVSIMKIDVEGAEIPALEGSQQILKTHHPALILEAGGDIELEALRAFLASFGYGRHDRDGYMPWNHLFLWNPG